jgi:phospholipid/cholesterol/gamma-HCH transport system permease protein
MTAVLNYMGRITVEAMASLGAFWIFLWRTLCWIPSGLFRPRYWALFLPQAYHVGALSVPVIVVSGIFIGAVLAVQAAEQFMAVGLENWMGVLVNLAVVRELGPVLAGVMIAGRVGGALTAELGTMNVTEQIDALRAMGADPIRHLVVPRFLACMLLAPILTFYCDVMGAVGGWIITVKLFNIPSDPYWANTALVLERWDLFISMLKSLAFGALIGLICCWKGFTCKGGAEGVGRECNSSFVASFLAILITDFFLAFVLKTVYEAIWGLRTVF